jgi:cell division protein FtsL
MGQKIFLYVMALTIPLSLGALVWHSARYSALKAEMRILTERQEEWVDNNKQLIADITALSSPARIAEFAKLNLGLEKKAPEDVLQIIINRGGGRP